MKITFLKQMRLDKTGIAISWKLFRSSQRMGCFEEMIIKAVQADGTAVFVMRITCMMRLILPTALNRMKLKIAADLQMMKQRYRKIPKIQNKKKQPEKNPDLIDRFVGRVSLHGSWK